jgi:hypothetical protein
MADNRVRVTYHGEQFWLDLGRVRRALVLKQCDGEFEGISHLAKEAKVSRSTASRFLQRGRASVGTARALVHRLGLKLTDVLEPVDG